MCGRLVSEEQEDVQFMLANESSLLECSYAGLSWFAYSLYDCFDLWDHFGEHYLAKVILAVVTCCPDMDHIPSG